MLTKLTTTPVEADKSGRLDIRGKVSTGFPDAIHADAWKAYRATFKRTESERDVYVRASSRLHGDLTLTIPARDFLNLHD